MSDRIHELLNRNLQEVFGDGDAARRRAAIEELYTEDCVLYVPVGIFVGRDALDKFAGDLRATHPHFAYTPRGEPQALHNAGRLALGVRSARRTARLYRLERDHRPWRQDRCALCVPRFNAVMTQADVLLAGSTDMNIAAHLIVPRCDGVTANDGSDRPSRPLPASRPARHR